MWQAIGIISLLAVLASLVAIIVGLVIGIARKRWRVLKWSSIACAVAFILLIVAVAIDSGSDDSQAASASPQTSESNVKPAHTATPNPTATPTPIRISATELIQAYESNEVAAEANYANKFALITGEISSVTEAGSKYDVDIRTSELFSWSNVVCKVSKDDESIVFTLAAGQTITVLGVIKGKGFNDIVVESCVIQ